MPIAYDIDQNAQMATVVLEGEVTLGDLKGYFDASSRDPRFHGGLRRLMISSGIRSFPRADEIVHLSSVARARDAAAEAKVAVVATTPLSIGVTNMLFRMLGLEQSYEIFPDEPRAIAWLSTNPKRVASD